MSTIDDLQRLHEAATPGAWQAKNFGPTGELIGITQSTYDEELKFDDWVPVAYFSDHLGDGRTDLPNENRDAIVALHNAWPAIHRVLVEAREAARKLQGDEAVDGLCEALRALDDKEQWT